MKVIIKDIPLSVDDQVIVNEIEKKKVQIMSKVQRRKLRVNGLLTECYTGDRMLFVAPPAQPLPRVMNMGSFKARVFHDGQDKGPTHCSRCLAQGHHASTCVKPIVCRKCLQPGHKSFDCDQQQAEKDDHTPDETMETEQTRNISTKDVRATQRSARSAQRDDQIAQTAVIANETSRESASRSHGNTSGHDKKAQSKITQYVTTDSHESQAEYRTASEDDSEADDDGTGGEESDRNETPEEQYSELSIESPVSVPPTGPKKTTATKRKQKSKSKSSKKK